MPGSRRYSRRKRRGRTSRRRFQRRRRYGRVQRSLGSVGNKFRLGRNSISVCRQYYGIIGFTGGSTVNPYANGTTFQISDIPGIASYNIFDQYRINAVVIKFYSPYDKGGLFQAGATYSAPILLHTAIDLDSATALGVNDLSAYQSYRVYDLTRTGSKAVAIKIRPRFLEEVYRSSTTTGYKLGYGGWLDYAYNDIPHYGFKFTFEAMGASGTWPSTFSLRYQVKYYVSFKNLRA